MSVKRHQYNFIEMSLEFRPSEVRKKQIYQLLPLQIVFHISFFSYLESVLLDYSLTLGNFDRNKQKFNLK